MKQPNANLSEEQSLCIFSQPNEYRAIPFTQESHAAAPQDADDILTLEDARIALEAIQRINAKLEEENASLKVRLELLDRLVVKLLKRNSRSSNRSSQ